MENQDDNQPDRLFPSVKEFSEALAKISPNSWQAKRFLYSTLFIRSAVTKDYTLKTVEEFQRGLGSRSLSLPNLLFSIVELYGENTSPSWADMHNLLKDFYFPRTRNALHSYHPPSSFRPLASLYHIVQCDIKAAKEKVNERESVCKELQNECQTFSQAFPNRSCPLPRRYVNIKRTADFEKVHEEKEEAFRQIFHRCRELFYFEQEELHFYHAAALIEFVHSIGKRRFQPESKRKDDVAFIRQAELIKTFKDLFVNALEKCLKSIAMDEVVKFLTDKMIVSRKFCAVRTMASKEFVKMSKLLGEEENVLDELPNPKTSLALILYRAFHERRVARDKLSYHAEKLKKSLEKVQGWESETGVQIFAGLSEGARNMTSGQGSQAPVHSEFLGLQEIVANAQSHELAAAAETDEIVAAAPDNGIDAAVETDEIVAAAQTGEIVAAAPDNGIDATVETDEIVAAAPSNEMIAAAVTNEMFAAAETDEIVAAAPDNGIDATVETDEIIAAAQSNEMIAAAEINEMFAAAETDEIVAAALDNGIDGAVETDETIAAAQSNEMFAATEINEMFAAAETDEIVAAAQSNEMFTGAETDEITAAAQSTENVAAAQGNDLFAADPWDDYLDLALADGERFNLPSGEP